MSFSNIHHSVLQLRTCPQNLIIYARALNLRLKLFRSTYCMLGTVNLPLKQFSRAGVYLTLQKELMEVEKDNDL